MTLAIYFLSELLGVSVVAGVATLILLVPLQGYIVTKVKGFQVHNKITKAIVRWVLTHLHDRSVYCKLSSQLNWWCQLVEYTFTSDYFIITGCANEGKRQSDQDDE